MFRFLFGFAVLVGVAFGQWNPNYAPDRYGIVHLFEWHWGTIADECENFLAPNKIGGVQTSPPNENRIVDTRPWWERYQPVSYVLGTRSGDRAAFIDMVDRCNAVGVRIYPDIVINHMCGNGGAPSTGTAGSWFNPDKNNPEFPSVPFGVNDFNQGNCHTANGEINNYGDADQVRNCMLVGLLDLNQRTDYVRGKIIDYMNDLINIGVAGFRVDACKHMYPGDLQVIFDSLSNLNTAKGFPAGSRAFMFSEVIDQGGEPISASQYTGLGTVTEFKYGLNLGNNRDALHNLENFGEAWGMLAGTNALSFINNHDNQRGHGGGGSIVSFDNPYDLKILTAYMLAWPYGQPRVMSSYYFDNTDQGPPGYQRSIESDGSCGNGWVCEHRWRQIKNMFAFGQSVQGQPVYNWWTNGNNQIAFSRGNKGFIAINKAGYDMSEYLNTGLADGSYCNVIEGDYYDGKCAGECITVSGGMAQINIYQSGEPILAIYSDAMTSECNVGGGGGAGSGTGGNGGGGGNVATTCTDCTCADSEKVDCGELASTEATCTASGCLWCPAGSGSTAPWCFYKAAESTGTTTAPGNGGGSTGGTGGNTCTDCTCPDNLKEDCGELASTAESCAADGCLWCPLSTRADIPWCFQPIGSIGTIPSPTTAPGGEDSGGTGGNTCTDCTCPDNLKEDCGELASTAESCAADGCLWCPLSTRADIPWCFHPIGTISSTTAPPDGEGSGGGGGGDVQCSDCSCPSEAKTDCGFMGITSTECVNSGCLWCPSEGTSDPWCIHVSESTGGGGGEVSCSVTETSRQECGYYGIQQNECENNGCCWAESNLSGVPWCYTAL
uniref:alpha-amylase-like isoform X1 n=1 Tax=Styela clava TaxID=7725 RepID=UPI00193A212A|nr:alpha-amylase-like isoform X1 [Styela clava]